VRSGLVPRTRLAKRVGETLARLRARGQLTEIRAGDLRFRPEEAALFLNAVMGLALPSPRRRSRSPARWW